MWDLILEKIVTKDDRRTLTFCEAKISFVAFVVGAAWCTSAMQMRVRWGCGWGEVVGGVRLWSGVLTGRPSRVRTSDSYSRHTIGCNLTSQELRWDWDTTWLLVGRLVFEFGRKNRYGRQLALKRGGGGEISMKIQTRNCKVRRVFAIIDLTNLGIHPEVDDGIDSGVAHR